MALSTIGTNSIADDAVGNTKLDLTANYAFTGTISGAGSLNLVSTTTLATDAAASTVSLTGVFTSSYNTYLVVLTDLTLNGAGTSNNNLDMRFLDSSGNSIDSQINYVGRLHTQGGSPSDYGGNNQTQVALAANAYGDNASPICGYIYVFNPLKADSRRNFIGHVNALSNGAVSTRMFTQGVLLGSSGTHTAVHGIQFRPGGNASQINGANSTYVSSVKVYGLS